MKAVVLLSGGLDSMACVQFYKNLNYEINAVFYDYGQPALLQEMIAVTSIANYFQIPLQFCQMPHPMLLSSGEFICRNALMVLHTLSSIGHGTYKIILGIHDGTAYVDCSKLYIKKLNELLVLHTNGTIICEAPFVDFFKRDLINYILEYQLPIELTYSCEFEEEPCGQCPSCLDRKQWLNC